MSKSSELSNPRLEHLLHTLFERRKLWLIPCCAALLISWIYVYFIRAESYTARQTLIVRDDLLGQSLKPGQFESLDLMKSAQETILEIARKPQVVRKAMKTIGPARVGWFGISDSWPDDKTIENVQGSIDLSAPNGAEFGHTETVVLSAKSDSRERAAQFVEALLSEINVKINEVRDLRLRSMTNELTLIRDSAQQSLADSAAQLSAMEREIGADLPTLRSLSDPQSGEGSMSQTLLQIRSERRQYENRLHSAENQEKTLDAATHDPNAILATSDELFSFQPSLSRLKQELIEAQSALAESVGRYEDAHPEVQKHREQVRSMHRQIHEELDSARRGLNGQIATLRQKVENSLAQESEIESRFNRISSKRVDYLRLDEEVKKKTEVFNDDQSNLAAVQRLDTGNFDVALLTPVDEPQVSTRADGLGAKATILGSGLAGLLAGFGLILLLDPGPEAGSSALASPTPDPQLPNRTGTPEVTKPVAQAPVAQAPVTQAPVARPPTTQTPAVQTPVAQAPQVKTAAPAEQPSKPTGVPVSVNNVAKKVKPIQGTAPASLANSQTAPPAAQPGSTPVAAATAAPSRSVEIQAELNKAVARSSGKASGPAVEVKPVTQAAQSPARSPVKPATKPATSPVAQPAPTKAAVAELEQAVKSARNQSDSTGVPTAASILAAMEKVSSPDSTSPRSVVQPQQSPIAQPQQSPATQRQQSAPTQMPGQSTGVETPSATSPPMNPNPQPSQLNQAGSAQADQQQELELRRRTANPSKPTSPPIDSSTTFVSLQPDTPSAEETERSTNPFLNPKPTGKDGPAETARRLLEEAKAEAEQKGMVAPVVPVKPDAETLTQHARRLQPSRFPIRSSS